MACTVLLVRKCQKLRDFFVQNINVAINIFAGDEADGLGKSDATGSSTMKLVKPGPRSWSDVSTSYPLTTVSSQGDGLKLLNFCPFGNGGFRAIRLHTNIPEITR